MKVAKRIARLSLYPSIALQSASPRAGSCLLRDLSNSISPRTRPVHSNPCVRRFLASRRSINSRYPIYTAILFNYFAISVLVTAGLFAHAVGERVLIILGISWTPCRSGKAGIIAL